MHQEAHEHGDPHGHSHDHVHGHTHGHHSHEHPHAPPPRDSGPASEPGGNWGRSFGLWLLLGLLGLAIYSVSFFVDQTQYVYVTEFGKPVRLCVDPGLELKLPYQSVRRLDRRLQMASPPGSQMLTRDRPRAAREGGAAGQPNQQANSLGGPPLSIDWFVCWRITTPEFARESGHSFEDSVLKFVQSVGTMTGAQDRLRERIDSMLKAKVGQMSLNEFVSLNPSDIKLEELNRELTGQMRRDAMDQFGIEVVELRIKRFNHPEGVKPAIFDMIRAERQGVADKYRADGKSRAAEIRSAAETQRAQILSKALADAERIRGEGDAQAMRIANEAHSIDPQFYQLLRTLDTYRVILNEKTTMVLSSDSPLLKLLSEGMPQLTGPAQVRPAGVPASKAAGTAGPASGNGHSEPNQ